MTDDSLASALYPTAPPPAAERDDVPAEVQKLRDADIARRMYPPEKAFAAAIPAELVEAGVDAKEWSHVAADLNANHDDLQTFASLAQAHLNNPTNEETSEAWRAESAEYLKRMEVSDRDLDAARALVARDPRVHRILHNTGLGNHPKVVARFIELARSARSPRK